MVSARGWPTTFDQASQLQTALAGTVRVCKLRRKPRIIAAVDVAFVGPVRRYTHLIAGVVVYDLVGGRVLERGMATRPVTFPYVPGFLSFREAPAALAAIAKLSARPDVFVVDGQGLAHPRRFGLACHLGIEIDRPTVGCAKSRLVGRPCMPLRKERGNTVDLEHKGQIVGTVVRTRTNVKPVYVSVGHRITLPEAVQLVLTLAEKYRLPEPARMAHKYVTDLKTRRC